MMRIYSSIRSGAIAGAVATLVFTVIHDLIISDIWFSLPVMLAAGMLCGICLGWSYALLCRMPSPGGWLRYNTLYIGMLALLGFVSLLVFEPVTTAAELASGGAPPGSLIRQALPVTILSTLAAAAVISRQYARSWTHVGAVLLTSAVLVSLLGLNISLMGLVTIPVSSLYLLAEMIGLVFSLYLVFVTGFMMLEWRSLTGRRPPASLSNRI
ncbi:MAG: hypothetical protein R3335_11415 [Anaerolineales bacterium]|nr:hypothetical protein [Anaerolineales bacterium]